MKKIIFGLMMLVSTSAFAEFIPFGAGGYCSITSLQCDNGSSLSCAASGPYGGYCSAERNGQYVSITCQANGGSVVNRTCKLAR